MSKAYNPIEYETMATPRTVTADGVPVFCAFDALVPLEELRPNPCNPNHHGTDQIKRLAAIMQATGWRNSITVSKLSGMIVKGHGRLLAAQYAAFAEAPVEYQDYESEAEEWADLVADNRLYCLILSSKLPAAKAFKRWVTAEVLPTIRRTGGYSTQGAGNGAEETIRIMRELMDARAENAALRLKMAQEELLELRARLREAEAGAETQQTTQEQKREDNRIRQQRFREKQRQEKAQRETQM